MDDRDEERLKRLFVMAREARPDTGPVEEGFETRLTARIASEREERARAFAWIWRLVPVFSAIVLLLCLYSIFSAPSAPIDLGTALLDGSEESTLVDFLTGTMGG